jgi:hypothetical protein
MYLLGLGLCDLRRELGPLLDPRAAYTRLDSTRMSQQSTGRRLDGNMAFAML